MLPAIIAGVAGLAGGLLSRRSAESNYNKNVDMQREFAQQGVRWKVEDAKKAGVHPLYALGANTQSFSPIAVQDGLGSSIANMGQDISRAVSATQTAAERARSGARMGQLALERAELENELLRSQIAKTNSQLGPPFPSNNSGVQAFPVSSGSVLTRDLVELKPAEIMSSRSEAPWTTAGPAGPGITEYDLGPHVGGKWNLPSPQVTEALEDQALAKYGLLYGANKEKIDSYLKQLDDFVFPRYGSGAEWLIGKKLEAEQALREWSRNFRRYGKRR